MSEIVGREAELEELRRFLDGIPDGPCALIFEGEPGIGKTTLWNTGVHLARERSLRVLWSRPAEPGVQQSFSALSDLTWEISDETLADLPDPQQRALEVAMLRAEPVGRPVLARTVAAGTLGVVRALAAEGPCIMAMDDVQWVDRSSADVLSFVVRRLDREPVGLLMASRRGVEPPDPIGLVGGIDPSRLRTVPVNGLDRDSLGALIAERLGWEPSHPVLGMIHEGSGGNPFFALELARAALEAGGELDPAVGIPAPDDLAAMLRTRLKQISPTARDALLTASAAGTASLQLLERAVARPEHLDDALAESRKAGLIETHGEAVVFAHPLFASAMYAEASIRERENAHARLAAASEDPEARARHIALSTTAPDPSAAAALENAAHHAHDRGAEWAASELCRLAAELVPASPDADRLRAEAADHLFRAGNRVAGIRLLESVIAETLPGAGRADLLVRLAHMRWQDDPSEAIAAGTEALEEGAASDRTCARVHLVLAQALSDLGGADDVRRELAAAVACARSASDDALLAQALAREAFFDPGPETDRDVFEQAERSLPKGEFLSVADRPMWDLACWLVVEDRLDEARPIITSLIREAIEAGDEPGEGMSHMVLGMLEERAGNLERSRYHFDRMRRLGTWPVEHLTAAYVDALLGDLGEARRKLDGSLERGEDVLGTYWVARVRTMIGFVELSEGNMELAADAYASAWEFLVDRMQGCRAPQLGCTFIGDAVEAFVHAGLLTDAERLTIWLEGVTAGLAPRRACALARRSRGLILASAGDFNDAIVELERAMVIHDSVPVPFEKGRTLLALGSIRRRAKQKRRARQDLEEALAIFERIGTPLWAARARAELASISGRAPGNGELTPTEDRVARLAAAGRTNREIAEELFLSVRTVESHLSHAYHKLGVRSRTELAGVLDTVALS